MSSMMIETSLLAFAFLVRHLVEHLGRRRADLDRPSTPKAALTWSLIRPPILYWSREAALSRLTSVLPSRLASTRFSSSAIFSNSASRSCCCLTASSTFSSAGDSSASWLLGLAVQRRHREGQPGRLAAALGRRLAARPSRPAAAATIPGRRSREFPRAACLSSGFGSDGERLAAGPNLPGHHRLVVVRRRRWPRSAPGPPRAAGRRPTASDCRRCPSRSAASRPIFPGGRCRTPGCASPA